jgi:hypothetical protein
MSDQHMVRTEPFTFSLAFWFATTVLMVMIVSVRGKFVAANLTSTLASGFFHNCPLSAIEIPKTQNRQPEEDPGREENDFFMKFLKKIKKRQRYRTKTRRFRRKYLDILLRRILDK